jgi:hypothetical protein
MVLVKLAAALLCFNGQCYPALVGKPTPIGEFQMNLRMTTARGYGGDVIQFLETKTGVFAIHRIWLLKPSEKREIRIHSTDPKDRVITNGCINLEPEVYDKLKDCCSNDQLSIVP